MPRNFRSWIRRALALAIVLTAALPASAESLEGHWKGMILVMPTEYEIELFLHIWEENGELKGELTAPMHRVEGQPFDSISRDGSTVELVFHDEREEEGVGTFVGEISNGEIVGNFTEGEQAFPFKLSRGKGGLPEEEAEVVEAGSDATELRKTFNEQRDAARIFIIQSPVCYVCRNDVRLIQRYVLEEIDDPALRVIVVWRPAFVGDDPKSAADATRLISDPRVDHFWMPGSSVDELFGEELGVSKTPLWAMTLLYPAGVEWKGEGPPSPETVMHHQSESAARYPEEYESKEDMNAIALREWVRQALEPTRRP